MKIKTVENIPLRQYRSGFLGFALYRFSSYRYDKKAKINEATYTHFGIVKTEEEATAWVNGDNTIHIKTIYERE